jgi:hypothetical protein
VIKLSAVHHHHLDRFAEPIAVRVADGDPDEMLTTKMVADLIHVSTATLEIWRCRTNQGHRIGPPFVRLGPKIVRYPRGKVVQWLRSRSRSRG